jgi:hypothetical protein
MKKFFFYLKKNKIIFLNSDCGLIGSLAGAARALNDNTREQCLSPTDQKSVFAFKDN